MAYTYRLMASLISLSRRKHNYVSKTAESYYMVAAFEFAWLGKILGCY